MKGIRMGRESKLRNPRPESRTEYSNGDRKLYDRDKMPDGLDSDIWSLTLLFEQLAEKDGYSVPARPIVYTELYNRVSKDPDLSQLLRSDDAQYTRTRVTTVYDGTPYLLVEKMIHLYWDMSNGFDYYHSINNFCSIEVFNYLKDYVTETMKREKLHNTGRREEIRLGSIKPSHRTEEERILYHLMNDPRTEEESRKKIEYWQRDHT